MRTGYKWPNSIDLPCNYQFTGNANSDCNEFFQAAYRFAVWASQPTQIENQGSGVSYEICDHGDGVAAGITIRLNDDGFYADMYAEFIQVLWQLPAKHVDGDLTFTINPDKDRVSLHLWHD